MSLSDGKMGFVVSLLGVFSWDGAEIGSMDEE
jgi:hypothetical protein